MHSARPSVNELLSKLDKDVEVEEESLYKSNKKVRKIDRKKKTVPLEKVIESKPSKMEDKL